MILDDLDLHLLSQQQSIDLYELVIARHRTATFVIDSKHDIEGRLDLLDAPIIAASALDWQGEKRALFPSETM